MRQSIAVLAAAALAVASSCTRAPAPSPQHARAGTVAASLAQLGHAPAEERIRAPGRHEPHRSDADPSWSRPAGGGERGPAAAAADEIVRRLAVEQLTVLDLQTDPEPPMPQQASVNVAVVYGTGQSHPDHARYRVYLTRAGDRWAVVAVEATP